MVAPPVLRPEPLSASRDASPSQNAAQLLVKPPPLRKRPPPLESVESPQQPPALFPVIFAPVPAEAPAKASRMPTASANRGFFDETPTAVEAPSARRRTFRRAAWKRWLDVAIVSIFICLALGIAAALRFTVPVESRAVPGLPANLNELVAHETKIIEVRRAEAGELARAEVDRYLGAASEQAAASHLLPPPDGLSLPPFPPFAALPAAGSYAVQSARRMPGTDRFLVVVKPPSQHGPMFVVEQTESGPRLHAGPITQQSAGLFQKFTANPGEGTATLYVEVCPSAPDGERITRAQRPDLSAFRLVDVRSAFPMAGDKEWIFCLRPDSEAARTFARRAHDPAWRPAVIRAVWHRHREAGPFAEIESFVPDPWSGERPLPTAVTAAITR